MNKQQEETLGMCYLCNYCDLHQITISIGRHHRGVGYHYSTMEVPHCDLCDESFYGSTHVVENRDARVKAKTYIDSLFNSGVFVI